MKKNSFAFVLVFVFFAVHVNAQESEVRTWTSNQGSVIKAELVEFKDGAAKLRSTAGKTVYVKISQLSQADQDFLNQSTTNASEKQPFEVVGVNVAKPLPQQEGHNDVLMRWNEGTTVSLLVRVDDISIIDLDENASKVNSFVDDKKNDLMKSSGVQQQQGWSMFRSTEPVSCSVVDSEGTWALVAFHAPNSPADGCKSISLKADVALRAGSGSVITEHKNIDLSGKGQFNAGNATVLVKKSDSNMGMMGDYKMQIALVSKDALDTIKEYSFFNPQGEEIEYDWAGSSRSGTTSTIYIVLTEEVDTITIKTDTYEKFETIRIPVSLEIGLGI